MTLPSSVHDFRMISLIWEKSWPNEIFRDFEKRRILHEIVILLQPPGRHDRSMHNANFVSVMGIFTEAVVGNCWQVIVLVHYIYHI